MTETPQFAVIGGQATFPEPVPVGQSYWPEWDRYEWAARDIFARRFYTSQRFAGPLVVQLQRRLQEFLGVKHAILIRNAGNGLMIATHTLGLKGNVIVPACSFVGSLQSLLWSNCRPVLCDIDPGTLQMSIESARRLLKGGGIKGVLGVHLWGDAGPVDELEALANEYKVPLYFDAAHAFGCKVNDRAVGTYGQAEVFSFDAANIFSTGEGGCLTTNDDTLASKFIAMRGDEVSTPGPSLQSATARMSEIQAAIGLMMLDDFEHNRRNNEVQHRCYRQRLSDTPGITILQPRAVSRSNFQNVVGIIDHARFGLTRDQLLAVLRAENVAAEPLYRFTGNQFGSYGSVANHPEAPQNAELLAQRTLQLPIGARVTLEQIDQICAIIRQAHLHWKSIVPALTSRPAI